MVKEPEVSIVMNCHNGEKYLVEAIKSILKQTFKNWELIFWNNSSNDKSEEILRAARLPVSAAASASVWSDSTQAPANIMR